MNWSEFSAYHLRGLRLNEIKHGVLINMMKNPHDLFWGYDRPAQCALMGERALVLGNLTESQCRDLADTTCGLDYAGVMGPGLTTHWFANRASEHGIYFRDCEPQQIYVLRELPKKPNIIGNWREVTASDTELFIDWYTEFARESIPIQPFPPHEKLARIAESSRYLFWEVNGVPVSMAGTIRKLRTSAAITGVYTPPDLRGRGYAGAITAVVAERIIQQGLAASLYTDLRVPASNRCYARLGFQPAYPSFHYHR